MLPRLENHRPGLADENTDKQIWIGGFHEPAIGYLISLGLGNIHVVGGSLITPYANGFQIANVLPFYLSFLSHGCRNNEFSFETNINQHTAPG